MLVREADCAIVPKYLYQHFHPGVAVPIYVELLNHYSVQAIKALQLYTPFPIGI